MILPCPCRKRTRRRYDRAVCPQCLGQLQQQKDKHRNEIEIKNGQAMLSKAAISAKPTIQEIR